MWQMPSLSLLLTTCCALAQPSAYLPPLEGALRLSGNFGEVRSNHFHAGLDLKTDGVEGKAVRAIADGHVVRINVSPTGYGKALYVEHADGKTSVYAHLREFSSELASYVKTQQYAQEKFAVDLTLPKGKFAVKKGDMIAKSGNSGGSGGPHLHFEIRDTKDQVPLNPLDFGFMVSDDRAPEMQRLWVYSHATSGHVEGVSTERGFDLTGSGSSYRLKEPATVRALGPVSFGVAALDRFTGSANACGIYQMTVTVDGTVIHHHILDRMPFDQKRKVNAHIDFEKRQRLRDVVHRSYIAPLNDLKIYKAVIDRGMWHVAPGARHQVSISMSDHAGNRSELSFVLAGQHWNGDLVKQSTQVRDIFYPDMDNNFSTSDIRVNIPKGCLYDTLAFSYEMQPACAECLSPVHAIHNMNTPLEDHMSVSIRIHPIRSVDMGKLLIVSFDEGGRPIAEGGTVQWQWMTTKTRSFGRYAVMKDSLPPTIRPRNFRDQSETARADTLRFHLEDDLSGIASYRATLNGKWVLMEHDPKTKTLLYIKDERFLKGQNTLRIWATDKVGNVMETSITVR
jgi:hypothetical protein